MVNPGSINITIENYFFIKMYFCAIESNSFQLANSLITYYFKSSDLYTIVNEEIIDFHALGVRHNNDNSL